MLEYIGGVKSYDLFINLGSVLGSILLIFLCYRKSGSWKKTFAVFLLSLVLVELGFFAGRLVRGLSYGEGESLYRLLTYPQGNHFIGRVLFVMWVFPAAFCLIFKKEKEEWQEYLDLLCIFLTFQHIFNRIACLFNGCCTGKYYDGPFALRYYVPGKSGAGYSYPVYPTQIFEIVCMIVLLAALFFLYRRRKRLSGVFCIGFAVSIFISEFMMDKKGVMLFAGLTAIQYAAALLALTAPAGKLWLREKAKRNAKIIRTL